MKILITGSSGYLGKNTVRMALERDHDVVGLDMKSSGHVHERFREVIGDITNVGTVAGAVSGCDAVFHLAAALAQFEPDEKRMHQVNVGGTENALAAALDAGVKKFIFTSSVEVYGIDIPVPCTEEAPIRPVCQYGRDKIESEVLCRAYLERGLDCVIFRPPTINGPGQNEPFLVAQMDAISKGKPTLLPGGGHTRLQMVYVEDVAAALFLALENPASRGAILNLGSDDVPTLRELAEALYEYAGTKPRFININATLARTAVRLLSKLGISPLEPQHLEIALRDYLFDNSWAKQILGWRPTKNDCEAAIAAYDSFIAESAGVKK